MVSVKTSSGAPCLSRKEEGDEQSHQEQGISAELHATTSLSDKTHASTSAFCTAASW
jgi:hypothetical protein